MAFTENLSQFFEQNEFAVAVTIKNPDNSILRTISGIFENPLIEIQVADVEVEGDASTLLCQTADLAAVTHDHKFVVGASTYRLVKRTDDGTGVSTLWIRK